MMDPLKSVIAVFLLAIFSVPVFAERQLNCEAAERIEIRHSMLGFRDTRVFYLFAEQQAVLVLTINNQDGSFPVTGKMHLFDTVVSEKDIQKWINNQHSDGLYAGVPKPVFTKEFPKECCRVVSSRQIGTSKNPGPDKGMYKDFLVEFAVEAQHGQGQFELKGFTDTARVHVEIE